MKKILKITAITAISLASAGMIVACGDDGNESASSAATNDNPVKPLDGNSMKKQRNPASAGIKRPKAPDDVISDRPGGPKDKKHKKKRGNTKGSISDGLSTNPPAVSPESAK